MQLANNWPCRKTMRQLIVKMEAPKKKRRPGRPRLSDEERKASKARARAKYREKNDVDYDRRRIRLHVETFQQWRTLREKACVNSDDGFARLLMKCFSEHAEEYRDEALLARYQMPLPMGPGSQYRSVPQLVNQSKPLVQVKEEKPKRKRGRPPKNRALKMKKTVPEPPSFQYIPIIQSNASLPQLPGTVPSSPSERLKIPDEDLSNVSPSVRSARLAFSRALAKSFDAVTSPGQTELVRRNILLVPPNSGETIATPVVPVDDVDYHQENVCDLSLNPSSFGQTAVVGIAPLDDMHSQHEGTFEQSHGLMVGGGDINGVVYQDSAEEGYYSQASVQYGEVTFGDENCQSLQEQPEPQASENTESAENFVETNGSSHPASEPDESFPEAGFKEESVKLAHPLGKSDSKLVKVPDQMRRSRLNQITGGLLNRLKMKTMTAGPTQD